MSSFNKDDPSLSTFGLRRLRRAAVAFAGTGRRRNRGSIANAASSSPRCPKREILLRGQWLRQRAGGIRRVCARVCLSWRAPARACGCVRAHASVCACVCTCVFCRDKPPPTTQPVYSMSSLSSIAKALPLAKLRPNARALVAGGGSNGGGSTMPFAKRRKRGSSLLELSGKSGSS